MWDTNAYRCFYNKRAEGLVEVNSMQQAIDVANGDITVHDGDFLFVAKD